MRTCGWSLRSRCQCTLKMMLQGLVRAQCAGSEAPWEGASPVVSLCTTRVSARTSRVESRSARDVSRRRSQVIRMVVRRRGATCASISSRRVPSCQPALVWIAASMLGFHVP